MKKIGIFGGSFDPIHLGHIAIAEEFVKQFDLDRCFFVPNYISPHKINKEVYFSPKERIEIIQNTIKNNPKFKLDTYEINQTNISYTINTIEYFKSKFPNSEFFLLIGTDQLINFHLWHRYEDILEKVKLVVAQRKTEKENLMNKVNFSYYILQNKFIDISSTEIRKRIQNNESLIGLVHTSVISIVENKGKI